MNAKIHDMENIIALINRIKSGFSNFKNTFFFSLWILLFSLSASAQVVYTDIVPDFLLYECSLKIDLDNDGIIDIEVRNYYHSDQMETYHETYYINRSTVRFAIPSPYDPYMIHDTIDQNSNWDQQGDIYIITSLGYAGGILYNADEGFVGFNR